MPEFDGDMRLFGYIRMALEADGSRPLHQQRHLIGRMRSMAAQAHAASDRGMNILFGKHGLIVAVGAESRHFGEQELCIVRAVRVVAAGAHAARNRGMDCLVIKFRLVMACETEIRDR